MTVFIGIDHGASGGLGERATTSQFKPRRKTPCTTSSTQAQKLHESRFCAVGIEFGAVTKPP